MKSQAGVALRYQDDVMSKIPVRPESNLPGPSPHGDLFVGVNTMSFIEDSPRRRARFTEKASVIHREGERDSPRRRA
jgi:hypothetical protein